MRLFIRLSFLAALTLAHSASGEGTMTVEAYAETSHDTPYVLRLNQGCGKLLYIGIDHSTDPKSLTSKTIQALWRTANPDVVLVEGIFPQPPSASLDAAIRTYGEPGATAFLARQRGTDVASLELPFEEEVALLLKEFTPQQAALFYALRVVAQERQRTGSDALAKHLSTRLIPWLSRSASLGSIITSEASLTSLVSMLLPELNDWRAAPLIWFDPMPQSGARFTNSIARRLVQVRDEHMSKLVTDQVAQGLDVFAVVGASHVVMQEDKIRSALGCASRVDVNHSVRYSPPRLTCGAPCSQPY
jgi:hypothetical protein